ncbi:hypothetical protein MTO96_051526 [Rhipicephalus appendiculatus]
MVEWNARLTALRTATELTGKSRRPNVAIFLWLHSLTPPRTPSPLCSYRYTLLKMLGAALVEPLEGRRPPARGDASNSSSFPS